MALALDSDSNMISLGQFKKTEIIYYDNLIIMILMKYQKIITHTKKN